MVVKTWTFVGVCLSLSCTVFIVMGLPLYNSSPLQPTLSACGKYYEEDNTSHWAGNRVFQEDYLPSCDACCDSMWDSLICWPRTPAGDLATTTCPLMTMVFQAKGKEEIASKLCTENATWFRNEKDAVWTNYSLCTTLNALYQADIKRVQEELLFFKRWFPLVKIVSQVGYAVSLATLIVAIFVLRSSKKLRCPRNTLHLHLFVSFILRASMMFVKDTMFVQGVGLPADVSVDKEGVTFTARMTKNWECKVMISLWQYSLLANYSWILMEGLYLHNIIFLALFSDTSDITLYIALGWGLPCLFVAPWILARAMLEDTLCWTTHTDKHVHLLIRVPIIFSVLLSFSLFVNIVRVVLLKMKASSNHGLLERRHVRYRRWARSTLVLVPLFGVHYALFLGMSYYVEENETVEMVWLFCDQLFGSFQGCLVAFLYCLLNAEVRCELSRKWRSWRSRTQHSRANSLSSAGIAGHLLYPMQSMTVYHVPAVAYGPRASIAVPVAARMREDWL